MLYPSTEYQNNSATTCHKGYSELCAYYHSVLVGQQKSIALVQSTSVSLTRHIWRCLKEGEGRLSLRSCSSSFDQALRKHLWPANIYPDSGEFSCTCGTKLQDFFCLFGFFYLRASNKSRSAGGRLLTVTSRTDTSTCLSSNTQTWGAEQRFHAFGFNCIIPRAMCSHPGVLFCRSSDEPFSPPLRPVRC